MNAFDSVRSAQQLLNSSDDKSLLVSRSLLKALINHASKPEKTLQTIILREENLKGRVKNQQEEILEYQARIRHLESLVRRLKKEGAVGGEQKRA